MSKTKVLKPREAMKMASNLGWDVQPVRKTGEIRYKSPCGKWFISMAPGRTNKVSVKLSAALKKAIALRKSSLN